MHKQSSKIQTDHKFLCLQLRVLNSFSLSRTKSLGEPNQPYLVENINSFLNDPSRSRCWSNNCCQLFAIRGSNSDRKWSRAGFKVESGLARNGMELEPGMELEMEMKVEGRSRLWPDGVNDMRD